MNTKTKVLFSFLIIFIVGFISGYLVKSTYTLKQQHTIEQERFQREGWQRSGEMSQSERMERGRNRLARSLNLTDDQRSAFFPAMQEYSSEIRQTIRQQRESEHEYVLQRYQEFRDRVSVTLNEDQLTRMDAILHPDTVRTNRPMLQQRGRN